MLNFSPQLQVGSEYVVLQSGAETSEASEDVVATAANEAVIDFNGTFGQEQVGQISTKRNPNY